VHSAYPETQTRANSIAYLIQKENLDSIVPGQCPGDGNALPLHLQRTNDFILLTWPPERRDPSSPTVDFSPSTNVDTNSDVFESDTALSKSSCGLSESKHRTQAITQYLGTFLETIFDVVLDGNVEKPRFLLNTADMLAKAVPIHGLHVHPIYQNLHIRIALFSLI
jgi:hypothetical protein